MKHNKSELSEKLSSLLLSYVRAVIKEQLQITGETFIVGYGPDWRDNSELSPPVIQKFGIRTFFVDRQSRDSPISVLFVLTDKLGEVFKTFDFAPFLRVTLEDNGEDFFDFRSINDVYAVKNCVPLFTNNKNEDSYGSFVEAVEKNLLFTIIKHS
jgi:hypothetical protein